MLRVLKKILYIVFLLFPFWGMGQCTYSQEIKELYEKVPESCKMQVQFDTIVLCDNIVLGEKVPILFSFDEDKALNHVGYALTFGRSIANCFEEIPFHFVERKILQMLIEPQMEVLMERYKENSINIKMRGKPISLRIAQNKKKLLELFQDMQGMTLTYSDRTYKASLWGEHGSEISFEFPEEFDVLTAMDKKERDWYIASHLKTHHAKKIDDSIVRIEHQCQNVVEDSIYIERGSYFIIPEINNNVYYLKEDTVYALVFDSCRIFETMSNVFLKSLERGYAIEISHRMYGDSILKYEVMGVDFDDYFQKCVRYFGGKNVEDTDKLSGIVIFEERGVGCIHLASVEVTLADLLGEGTIKMFLHTNIPVHNLKELFPKNVL